MSESSTRIQDETAPDERELQALIEEARRRARKRRRGYLAGALGAGAVALGALLLFGGGGNGGPTFSNQPDPGSAGVLALGSGAPDSSPCPQIYTKTKVKRVVGQPVTLTGCEFRFHAELPPGWNSNHASLTVWPAPGPISILIVSVPSFSNSEIFGGETRPFSMAPGHIVINLEDRARATERNLARFEPPALTPTDFRSVSNRSQTDDAHARLIFGGFIFAATVFAHRGDETPSSLGEVNAVLDSMTASQRDCPCK